MYLPSYRILNHKAGSVSSTYQRFGLVDQHWSSTSPHLPHWNNSVLVEGRDKQIPLPGDERNWSGEIHPPDSNQVRDIAFRDDRVRLDEGKPFLIN